MKMDDLGVPLFQETSADLSSFIPKSVHEVVSSKGHVMIMRWTFGTPFSDKSNETGIVFLQGGPR